MLKHKFNVNIYRTVAIVCILILISHFFSINIQANSEIHSAFRSSNFANRCDHPYSDEDSKEEDETDPCTTETCSFRSCCNIMGLLNSSISINSNDLTKENIITSEQFYPEDVLRSIFKPPKI